MFTRCNFVLVIVTPSDTYLREQVAYQSVFDCSFQEKHVFIGTFEYLKLDWHIPLGCIPDALVTINIQTLIKKEDSLWRCFAILVKWNEKNPVSFYSDAEESIFVPWSGLQQNSISRTNILVNSIQMQIFELKC